MATANKQAVTSRLSARLKPVMKSSISDKIVEQIMSLIANGELKPGQHLPSERELCKNFHAGRSSIREALRCLCIVGVLTARVGEGTSVALDGMKFLGNLVRWRVITEQHDIEDLMEIRMALEGVAAASTARRADAAVLESLSDLISRMASCVNDQRRFAALDLEFHLSLAAASQNSLILDLISTIRSQLEKTVSRVLELPNARPHSHEEHVRIVKAIESGDSDAAREAMQSHLISAVRRYHRAVESIAGGDKDKQSRVRKARSVPQNKIGRPRSSKKSRGSAE
jgi:GntR family transcriptional repressor for pyruvate dehydrogenase complex